MNTIGKMAGKTGGTVSRPATQAKASKGKRLDRAAWVEGARDALIAGGEARVKVDQLARSLGVTTGSFYWHFKDRRELLDALLAHWEINNTRAMVEAVNGERDAKRQFSALGQVWLHEANYRPAYDSAVRDWARVSTEASIAVRRVDDSRIALIHGIFRRLGFPDPEAFVRARITYFHQVGYYALQIKESAKERKRLLPYYAAILTGAD